nr:hypothetical protein [Eubacterium sp.]
MKYLFGSFTNYHTRMRVVLLTILLFVSAFAGYFLFENDRLKEQYMEIYMSRQQVYTEGLADQLELVIENKGNMNSTLASYFAEHAEVSGNTYMFLCKDENIIFVKDELSTQKLLKTKTRSDLMESLRAMDPVITETTRNIGENKYFIGTVTDRDIVYYNGHITQHITYLYLMLCIIGLIATAAVIAFTAALNKADKKYESTYKDLQKKNLTIQEREDEMLGIEEHNDIIENEREAKQHINLIKSNNEYYDAGMIEIFLRKSDDEKLYPMQILFAEV